MSANDTNLRNFEAQKKRHAELHTRLLNARATGNAEKANLDQRRQEAEAEFGTSNVDVLRETVVETDKQNAVLIQNLTTELDDLEEELRQAEAALAAGATA